MRSRLLGTLYTSLIPTVDAHLFSLERLHAGDPPAEQVDIALFIRQWNAVRDLLSPPDLTAQPPAAIAWPADGAYQPASAHLDRLVRRELDDATPRSGDRVRGAPPGHRLIVGAAAGAS